MAYNRILLLEENHVLQGMYSVALEQHGTSPVSGDAFAAQMTDLHMSSEVDSVIIGYRGFDVQTKIACDVLGSGKPIVLCLQDMSQSVPECLAGAPIIVSKSLSIEQTMIAAVAAFDQAITVHAGVDAAAELQSATGR